MKIVCDDMVVGAEAAFGPLGELLLKAGGEICRDDLIDAKALVTRSGTRVGPELLEGTPVEVVTTATIGFDHVNTDYLASRNIPFASAAGSSAESVAEWVVAALLEASLRINLPLETATLGVVGVGHVGSRVAAKAAGLGMEVLCNDPPRARDEGWNQSVPLDQMLPRCDFVTLHVPLSRAGPDATEGLVSQAFLETMMPDSVLLNSARGQVVDEKALRAALDEGWLAGACIDVWNGEPSLDPETVSRVTLATPHIAGHSLDGKANNTLASYRFVCETLGIEPVWTPEQTLPPIEHPVLTIDIDGRRDDEVLREAVRRCFPITEDDKALRGAARKDGDAIGAWFKSYRKDYPVWREYHRYQVALTGDPDRTPDLSRRLALLGFGIAR